MNILIILSSLLLFLISIVLLKKSNDIKVEKHKEQSELLQEYEELKKQKHLIQIEIENKNNERNQVIDSLAREKSLLESNIESCKEVFEYAKDNYVDSLEDEYSKAEISYRNSMSKLISEKEDLNLEIYKIKNDLAAAVQARLREKENEENSSFYQLQLSEKELNEVKAIKGIEYILSDPRPLRMLIWTTYYSKKANELCSRVLGTNKIIGIYKITNIETKEVYVGQSKDCKERWREHMKCGLGIDTPAGNKLYKAMLEYGIDSFTFELLEKCSSEELNEKEKFFIDLYQSYDFGYNSTKGNKS